MTDHELARFLGIGHEPAWERFIAKLKPSLRARLEHLADACQAVERYDRGEGPKPAGATVGRRKTRRRTRRSPSTSPSKTL